MVKDNFYQSEDLAGVVCSYCDRQRLREDSLQFEVCFGLNQKQIAEVIQAAFNLSIETYEKRQIRGGFLFAGDDVSIIEQIQSWQLARLDLEIKQLSFESMKHVAGVLRPNTWAVLCPFDKTFKIIGIISKQRNPLQDAEIGSLWMPVYKRPPLAVSIDGPGCIRVAIGNQVLGERRGDRFWTLLNRDRLPFLALHRATGSWGEPKYTSAFINSVRRQLQINGCGGTIVIGPRIDLNDRSMLQPGAIHVSGICVAQIVIGDFPVCYMDLSRSKDLTLKEYLNFEHQLRLGEELRDIVVAMAEVDGAVLIDEEGQVYAYHAYFVTEGDASKSEVEGSRHRTLRSFVKKHGSWLAIAVSQDGGATILVWDYDNRRIVETRSRQGMLLMD